MSEKDHDTGSADSPLPGGSATGMGERSGGSSGSGVDESLMGRIAG